MWYIVVSVTQKREHTTTAALHDKMCAFICSVSAGMPGGNCSMNGMLLESCEGNAEDNGPMWQTLKCFACSLHCLAGLRTTAFMYRQCGQVGTRRALKEDANSLDTARIPKSSHFGHFILHAIIAPQLMITVTSFQNLKKKKSPQTCGSQQEIILTPSLSLYFFILRF